MKIGTERFLTILNVFYYDYEHWIGLEVFKWINNSFHTYKGLGIRAYALYGASTEFVIKNETFLPIAAGNHFMCSSG